MRRSTNPDREFRATAARRRGVTLLELLIVVSIIVVLLSVLVPVVARVRQAQSSMQCLSTLGKIAAAFHSHAAAHQGKLPNPGLTDKSWEQLLATHFDGPFQCPSDEELFPALGSSYDWRDTGKDQTTLAGRRLVAVGRPETILVFEAMPGWHAKGQVNVARIDGSATPLSEEDCYKQLAEPIWKN